MTADGYRCAHCYRWFAGTRALSRHRQVHLPLEAEPPEIVPEQEAPEPDEGLSGYTTREKKLQ